MKPNHDSKLSNLAYLLNNWVGEEGVDEENITYNEKDTKAWFVKNLFAWAEKRNADYEERIEAAKRILKCRQDSGATTLDLEELTLKSLPECIGNLTHLINLNLPKNQLTNLPSGVENLINLEYLNLSENNFITFPKEIRNLHSLLTLNFSHNPFNDNNFSDSQFFNRFSSEIMNLVNLGYINFSNNSINIELEKPFPWESYSANKKSRTLTSPNTSVRTNTDQENPNSAKLVIKVKESCCSIS